MYLEHFQLDQHPFQEEPDPEIFFPEAERIDILRALLKDIQDGQSLIRLSGREGTGKTQLRLMLAAQLPGDCKILCLDNPIGSFEDLLRVIYLNLLGEDSLDDAVPSNILESFRNQLLRHPDELGKVVLIIDEAEKLFLATLERLIRMICDTELAGMLQVVLIGRPEVDVNLDQLAIYCSNIDVNSGYSLEPLTLEETGRYLYFCCKAAGFSGTGLETIFTDDAVLEIYRAAMGNLRLTNRLAREALEKACLNNEMSCVLPEHVNPRLDAGRSVRHKRTPPADFLKRNTKWVAAGAVAMILLLLMFFWPRGEEDKPPVVVQDEQAATSSVNSVGPTSQSAVGEIDKAADLTPEGKKQRPESAAGQIIVQAEAKKKKKTEEPFMESRTEMRPQRDGEQILNDRKKATSTWLAWAYRGGFTIQLMMLASDQAVSNLESMLIADDYYSVKDKLYILNKPSPPVIYVFYGMYNSMKEARDVRNKMPAFLRKHQPYALSINDALKKTRD